MESGDVKRGPVEVKKFLEAVEKGTIEECTTVLNGFNAENEKAREIEWLAKSEKVLLWDFIFARLNEPLENSGIINQLLNALRILSRDKEILESVMTDERVQCLVVYSGLKEESRYATVIGHTESLNGMKVIFNMVFQSEELQGTFIGNGLLKGLVGRIKPNDDTPLEVQHFLLKTFFIITALSKGSGKIVRDDLNGVQALLDYMDVKGDLAAPYDKPISDVICESLKVLYNITHAMFPDKTDLKAEMYTPEEFRQFSKMCGLIRRNLIHDTTTSDKKVDIDMHSIHLLTCVPHECYAELYMDVQDAEVNAQGSPNLTVFEGKDLRAIDSIVSLLNIKLDSTDRAPTEPILLVLYKMASKNRIIRKYLKLRILPPLTREDLQQRPELGPTIRNKLCAVIHRPSGNATEVAVNLLFVLCKEKVRTLVKYTGYGNAAGLLADRGLMLGGQGDSHYSDESEESDTEEYNELRDQINDIEGWIKPEQPPLEMTDEQKEHEARKLVETIAKLSTSNVIQPCRIGPDGKPQLIEHVLELQESLDNASKNASAHHSDTDSE